MDTNVEILVPGREYIAKLVSVETEDHDPDTFNMVWEVQVGDGTIIKMTVKIGGK